MKQVLTVSCKLQVTQEQVTKLNDLLKVFADACEYVNRTVKEGLANELAMQSLVYNEVRALFGLPSQLAIHAIRRVAGNRKTAKQKGKPVKGFARSSATYDVRTFSFREKDWTVSLTMLGKRERFPLAIGNYQRSLLQGQNPKTATLVKRRDGSFYLNIQLESQPPKIEETNSVLGCDLGRTDICVTSSGDKYSGKQVTKIRDKYSDLRTKLQQKAARGTRGSRRRCRRLLQRLSGKERRFQSHVNHTISYRLVQKAKTNQQTIALEDLTGIRERTNELPRSKTERRKSNSWSFYQLRQYLTYKSVKFGVKLVFVNPAYTSKSCHCCGVIGNRNGKHFRCVNLACGWSGDSDLNGAKNIEAIGQLINLPGGSGALSCSWRDVVLRATENATLNRQVG
ncbi:RNA-guided endonuclease InsQ/TnpB family protein [Gloeocapsopsis dulcis]|uniref:Transposase n=1 Tax=Gloeocapsopsis dulcis AAB1 = 1H9 TaxID=1433147 RepID=A0A6N8FPP1_9CHRO|nr:RNA-guided endonuclease TnpB family protein [Gloeocapsopsis dulcis]MUL34999.1 transposase [Gloeocapsopsis dulcis AAB1 = 1H9]WNN89926.1 transposase [Gloeocapsopsis dulcis]